LIEKFAGYGFNKSHSTAYALIAYMTAYLKAHYPVEFMAALLSGDIPGRNFRRKDALVEHREDCRRMGIEVVPPSVNSSHADFTVADGRIFFGLAAVKGCGEAAAAAITTARAQGRPFSSLFDFCERVDPAACPRASIETLIKAGAFDALGVRRAQCLAGLDRAIQAGAAALADRRSGQRSLFEGLDDTVTPALAAKLPDVPEWDEREKLAHEKEVLGFFLSSHPLAEHEQTLANYCSHTTSDLAQLRDRAEVVVGGMLSAIKTAHVRKARAGTAETRYVNFDLEDLEGSVRCILWPDEYAQFGQLVEPDAVLVARGVVDRRGGDEVNLIVNELIPLDQLDARYTRGVVIRVQPQGADTQLLDQLLEIVRGYPGNGQLQLSLWLEDGSRVLLKATRPGIEVSPELRRRVEELLGPGNLRVLTGSVAKDRGPAARRPAPARSAARV
jgi:DNA polymerase-3 subunit alpha